MILAPVLTYTQLACGVFLFGLCCGLATKIVLGSRSVFALIMLLFCFGYSLKYLLWSVINMFNT